MNPHNFVGDRSIALSRMEHAMQTMMRTTLLVLALVPWGTESALAQAYPPSSSGPPSTAVLSLLAVLRLLAIRPRRMDNTRRTRSLTQGTDFSVRSRAGSVKS